MENPDALPVIGPDHYPEPEPDTPLVVDRNDPDQQKLATLIGWDRIEKIAESEREAHEKMALE